jgi:hypothetical protein
MTTGEFSVRQFFRHGDPEDALQQVDAPTAVYRAKMLIDSVGGQIGNTVRVVIIDGGDCIVFDWRFGDGIIFPPPPPSASPAERRAF